MKAVVTNGAVRMCKAPVKSSPPTKTDTQLFTGRIPSCRPTNTVRALKAKQHCQLCQSTEGKTEDDRA